MTTIVPLDPNSEARPHFPALQQQFIYADSAGGSQCLATVAHAISDYLLSTNVQLGASYSVSTESSRRVSLGAKATAGLMEAADPKSIIFGSSSTQVVENLARAFEDSVIDGDEFVIAEEHETNVGPWVNLAKRLEKKGIHVVVKFWKHCGSIEEENVRLDVKDLEPLLNEKTKFVAFSATSNVLGALTDISAVVKLVKEKTGGRAKTCLDCVAFGPHRRVKVQSFGIDFAFFSYYKVFGPHACVLYASPSALASLTSLAHFFLKLSSVDPYKLAPGGASYEIVYGASFVPAYILSLAGTEKGTEDERFDLAFDRIALHEEKLTERLMNYLISKRDRGVRIVGPISSKKEDRAPTISFVVRGEKPLGSQFIVEELDKTKTIGVRFGNFYAVRLCRQIKLDEDDGVVRISFAHYTTLEEVDTIIKELDLILV